MTPKLVMIQRQTTINLICITIKLRFIQQTTRNSCRYNTGNLETGVTTTFLATFLCFFLVTEFTRGECECVVGLGRQGGEVAVPVRVSADKLIRTMDTL